MSAIEITKNVASKVWAGKTKLETLTPTAITPYLNINNTYEAMVDFLTRSHNNGEATGMEINYSDGETRVHLLTESDETYNMRSRFMTQHNEYAEFDDESTVENPQFEIGDYMSTAQFYLSEDYWYPLLDYNNASGNGAVSDDALASIIHEIAKNRRSEENVRLQLICHPIPDSKWKVRRPLTNYLLAPYRLMIGAKRTTYYLYELTSKFTQTITKGNLDMRNLSNIYTKIFREITDSITDAFNYIQGYNYYDKQDDLEDKKHMQEERKQHSESWSKSDERYLEDLQKSINRIDNKVNRKGFIVELRLMVTGENKNGVENKIDRVIREIERKMQVEGGTEALNQSLDANKGKTYTEIINIGLEMFQRDRGVDFHRRIEDTEKFSWIKRSRSKPTILTPPEIATLMHVPDETVTDNSIKRKEPEEFGESSPEQPSF